MSDSDRNGDRSQPNKPGGNFDDNREPRDAGDLQAVKNQGEVSPDDYPAAAGLKHSESLSSLARGRWRA